MTDNKEAISLILHIMSDQVFSDMAIRDFERISPGIHEYHVLSKTMARMKSSKAVLSSKKKIRSTLLKPDLQVVIFHSLPPAWYSLLINVPKKLRIVWIGMGFDYYFLFKKNLILPHTSANFSPTKLDTFKSRLINTYIKFKIWPFKSLLDQLQNVDYFAPVLESEYHQFVQSFPIKAQFIPWNYGSVEEDFICKGNENTIQKGHILVGNSAYETNNHFDIILQLTKSKILPNVSIYTPLSYGREKYRDAVISFGKKHLGDAFVPINKFLSKDEYNHLVGSCSFVIMNHLRQQGLGNIVISMLSGARVFLHPQNPLFQWFKSQGAIIGSTTNLELVPLNRNEKEINRKIVYKNWGFNSQKSRSELFIQKILS